MFFTGTAITSFNVSFYLYLLWMFRRVQDLNTFKMINISHFYNSGTIWGWMSFLGRPQYRSRWHQRIIKKISFGAFSALYSWNPDKCWGVFFILADSLHHGYFAIFWILWSMDTDFGRSRLHGYCCRTKMSMLRRAPSGFLWCANRANRRMAIGNPRPSSHKSSWIHLHPHFQWNPHPHQSSLPSSFILILIHSQHLDLHFFHASFVLALSLPPPPMWPPGGSLRWSWGSLWGRSQGTRRDHSPLSPGFIPEPNH